MKASNAVLQQNFPRQTEEITKILNKYSLAPNRDQLHPTSIMSAATFNVEDFILLYFSIFKSCLPYYVSPLFPDILK